VYELIGKKAPESIYNIDVEGILELDISVGNYDVIGDVGYYIHDLSGIEHFRSLRYLDCYQQLLEELDLSGNTALEYLACSYNKLRALNVTKNTALIYLDCCENQLTKLDVSGLDLDYLNCSYNYMPDPSAVKGFPIDKWDGFNYVFYPQNENFKFGDVDGDGSITPYDATLVLQHIVGMITLEGNALKAADTDHDGRITPYDATLILQYIVGMIKSFD
jgi:hypothetical protein